VRSISYTYGRVGGDPYATITKQPEEVTSSLAGALELRAKEQTQRSLRMELLGELHGHVVEVGTGTGAIAREVAKMESVTAVTGIDPSRAFLRRAKELAGPKERYEEAFSTNLRSVDDASVDHALLWTTLLHIPEEEHAQTFSELRRVLKAGGTLHVFDNDPCAWDFRMCTHDPLVVPVQAMLEATVPDRFVMRRVPQQLSAAGLKTAPLRLHTVLDTSAESYGYQSILLRAIEEFAATKVVGAPMIDAMKAEAERRVATGEFAMALSFGYISATKPA